MRADGRTDGRAGMIKLIIAFRNFMKAPKNQKMETVLCVLAYLKKTHFSRRRLNFSLIYKSSNLVELHFLHSVVTVLGDGTVFA